MLKSTFLQRKAGKVISPPAERKDLNEVHLIRGAASLLVCLFHLCLGNSMLFPSPNLFKAFCSSGYFGVEVFFVLTGYVLCFAFPAYASRGNTGRFLLKRLIRIEPPYLASIALVLLLNTVSHLVTGMPNQLDFVSLAGHLVYVNNFNPQTYVNIVYWTLGVELQFYLVAAVLFPFLLGSTSALLLILSCFLFAGFLPVIPGTALLYPYLGFFGLGMVLSLYKQRKLNWQKAFPAGCLFLFQLYFLKGLPALTGGAVVCSVLLFWTYGNLLLKFFSMISFSLYLTHVPVGGKVINLGLRYVQTSTGRYLLLVFAVIVSLFFAYLFYRFVEKPALRYAKRFRYSAAPPQAAAPVVENRAAPTVLRPAAPGVPA